MMEQTAPTDAPPLKHRSTDVFICMLLISLLLHASLSLFVYMPGRTITEGRRPLFVDLAAMPMPPMPPSAHPAAADEPEPAEPPAPVVENPPEPLSPAENLDRTINETLREAAGMPEAAHRSGIGLGMTAGYFGSFAEGATLREEIREYYFTLMRRINEVWWTRNASSPSAGASFILVVSRDGKVIACDPLQGSGDPRSDRLLAETVKLAEPLPPLPAGYPDREFNAPIRFIPPLGLMLPGVTGRAAPPHG